MGRPRRRWAAPVLALLSSVLGLVAAGPALGGPDDLPGPDVPADRVHQVTREVLARQEYRRAGPGVADRISQAISRFLDRLFGRAGQGGGFGLVSIVLLVAVAALLVAVVLRFLRNSRADPHRGDGVVVGRELRPAGDWRSEAEAHAERGEWRDAVRCRYRALVADLAARGLVEEVPGRTTGEYRRQLGASAPGAAVAFAAATELFELAWYAAATIGPDEDRHFRHLEAGVLGSARR